MSYHPLLVKQATMRALTKVATPKQEAEAAAKRRLDSMTQDNERNRALAKSRGAQMYSKSKSRGRSSSDSVSKGISGTLGAAGAASLAGGYAPAVADAVGAGPRAAGIAKMIGKRLPGLQYPVEFAQAASEGYLIPNAGQRAVGYGVGETLLDAADITNPFAMGRTGRRIKETTDKSMEFYKKNPEALARAFMHFR